MQFTASDMYDTNTARRNHSRSRSVIHHDTNATESRRLFGNSPPVVATTNCIQHFSGHSQGKNTFILPKPKCRSKKQRSRLQAPFIIPCDQELRARQMLSGEKIGSIDDVASKDKGKVSHDNKENIDPNTGEDISTSHMVNIAQEVDPAPETTRIHEIMASHITQETLTTNVQKKMEVLSISKHSALHTLFCPLVPSDQQGDSEKHASKIKQKKKIKTKNERKRTKNNKEKIQGKGKGKGKRKGKRKEKANSKRSTMKDITNTSGMFAMSALR